MNIEEYKERKYLEFINDPYISKFIKDNKLDKDTVMKNFLYFEDCYNSLLFCKNCNSINDCKQARKGEYVTLTNEYFINNDVTHCKKYLKELEDFNYNNKFVYSDIPAFYKNLDLSNINIDNNELKNLFGFCYLIYEGKANKGLYIYGSIGVGKTYLCIALANSLMNKGYKVAFIKTNDFVTKMSKMIVEDNLKFTSILSSLQTADYLILDDIGSEVVSDFSRDRLLYNILDYRMERKMITIFTSNLDKKALHMHYSLGTESIKADRLLERIDILSEDYCLEGKDRRRINND